MPVETVGHVTGGAIGVDDDGREGVPVADQLDVRRDDLVVDGPRAPGCRRRGRYRREEDSRPRATGPGKRPPTADRQVKQPFRAETSESRTGGGPPMAGAQARRGGRPRPRAAATGTGSRRTRRTSPDGRGRGKPGHVRSAPSSAIAHRKSTGGSRGRQRPERGDPQVRRTPSRSAGSGAESGRAPAAQREASVERDAMATRWGSVEPGDGTTGVQPQKIRKPATAPRRAGDKAGATPGQQAGNASRRPRSDSQSRPATQVHPGGSDEAAARRQRRRKRAAPAAAAATPDQSAPLLDRQHAESGAPGRRRTPHRR